MQAPKCLGDKCLHEPFLHGLCLDHYDQTLHPSSGRRHGRVVTMAGKLFSSLTYGARMEQVDDAGQPTEVTPVLPVVTVPFIREQDPDFIYTGPIGNRQPVEPHALRLREELVTGIQEINPLNKPIVFLVITNIPHTSIYILHQGRLYSVGYGYYMRPAGALYSIDIPLGMESEARIVWIGILTSQIMVRLQHEFNQVTEVSFDRKTITDDASNPITVVNRLMFFHVPKTYGGLRADASAMEWNCSKWAMTVLFGDKKPQNIRDLVSRTNPGLSEDQITKFLEAYRGKDGSRFIAVLKRINDPRFPMGGRRRRMTKRKPIKMRKTRRMR